MVVHNDNLKAGYIPLDSGRIVSRGRDLGDFAVVPALPQPSELQPPPRRLRGDPNVMNSGKIYVLAYAILTIMYTSMVNLPMKNTYIIVLAEENLSKNECNRA